MKACLGTGQYGYFASKIIESEPVVITMKDHDFAHHQVRPKGTELAGKRRHHHCGIELSFSSLLSVAMRNGVSIESLIYSFYNSLTLCFTELDGRYYGGGVLEFTPNEFKKVPIPIIQITKRDFQTYKSFFEQKSSIEDVLKKFDVEILNQTLKITPTDVLTIRSIRNKLVSRD